MIEQAKGMLMLIYGLEVIKPRRLAQQLVDEFRDVRDQAISNRSPFDEVLFTVRADGDEAMPSTAN